MRSARILAFPILALLLASCGSSEAPPVFSEIAFEGPPIQLNVSAIDVASDFEPTFHAPEVEQNFPILPQRALINWAHQKLAAADPSSTAHARVTILDASAHELGGPGAYDIKLAVRVDIVDPVGNRLKSLTLQASRTASVDPDASADERDMAWYEMTRDAVSTLTASLERHISEEFYPYVR